MRRQRLFPVWVGFFVFFLVFNGLSQQGAGGALSVPVVVTDSAGNPISGLRPEDIAISQDGKDVKLDSLTPVSASHPPPIVLVFDTVHTRYVDEGDVRQQLLRFLSSMTNQSIPTALLVTSSKGIRLVHDYRLPLTAFAQALAQVNTRGKDKKKAMGGGLPAPAPPPDTSAAAIDAETDQLLDFLKGTDSNPTAADQPVRAYVDVPLDAWRGVALALADLPGRKTIVWISNTAPFQINGRTALLESPSASGHGAAVYGAQLPDRRELFTEPELRVMNEKWRSTLSLLARTSTCIYSLEVRGAGADHSLTISAMQALAAMTGGRALFGTNDFAGSLSRVAADNAAAYMAQLRAAEKPGWHKLVFKSVSPDSKLLALSGFFPTQEGLKATQSDLVAASLFPLDASAFPVTASWLNVPSTPGLAKVPYVLLLPPASRVVDEISGQVDLDFMVTAFTNDGKKAAQALHTAKTVIPAQALQQIRQDGIQQRQELELSSGSYSVRFLVRDNLTGRVGSTTIPLRIP